MTDNNKTKLIVSAISVVYLAALIVLFGYLIQVNQLIPASFVVWMLLAGAYIVKSVFNELNPPKVVPVEEDDA